MWSVMYYEWVGIGKWVDPCEISAKPEIPGVKYRQSVSGAVGAICRHSSVLRAMARRDDEGRYL